MPFNLFIEPIVVALFALVIVIHFTWFLFVLAGLCKATVAPCGSPSVPFPCTGQGYCYGFVIISLGNDRPSGVPLSQSTEIYFFHRIANLGVFSPIIFIKISSAFPLFCHEGAPQNEHPFYTCLPLLKPLASPVQATHLLGGLCPAAPVFLQPSQ